MLRCMALFIAAIIVSGCGSEANGPNFAPIESSPMRIPEGSSSESGGPPAHLGKEFGWPEPIYIPEVKPAEAISPPIEHGEPLRMRYRTE
jgi:hypothetical protein